MISHWLTTFFISTANAQVDFIKYKQCDTLGLRCSPAILSTIETIVNALLVFVGIIATLVLIYAGIRYILSLGDEKNTEAAKHTILYAVVGLIVIGLSAMIVNFIIGAIRS